MALSDQDKNPVRHTRDTWDTATAHYASPEIAGSNDGRVDDGGANTRSRPFIFDVFTEGDDGAVSDGQSPAKMATPSFLRRLIGTS